LHGGFSSCSLYNSFSFSSSLIWSFSLSSLSLTAAAASAAFAHYAQAKAFEASSLLEWTKEFVDGTVKALGDCAYY